MKKKIFIHVGLHKTATTFFQKKIFPFLKNTNCLCPPYTQENLYFNKLQYGDDSLYDSNSINEEIGKLGDKNLIISDEQLSGIPNSNYINRSLIASRLSDAFPEAEIILFLRGQKDIMLSLYNQAVKVGRTSLPIQKYIWFPERNTNDNEHRKRYFNHWYRNIHPDHFLYYELIQMYCQRFSKVHIFLYEEFKQNPLKVIDKILETMNDILIYESSLNKKEYFKKQVNQKLSDQKLDIIRYENLLKPIINTNHKIILKPLSLAYAKFVSNFNKLENYIDNESYVEQLINNYFYEDNHKVIASYPDVPMKKYSNAYQI